jgi:hypothetical protein
MKALLAIWQNGQVVLDGRADWPEGCRLIVKEDSLPDIDFMTEDEQSNDPVAIQRWIDDLRSIPALTEDPTEEAAHSAWNAEMKRFNVEAVRKQFEGGERS